MLQFRNTYSSCHEQLTVGPLPWAPFTNFAVDTGRPYIALCSHHTCVRMFSELVWRRLQISAIFIASTPSNSSLSSPPTRPTAWTASRTNWYFCEQYVLATSGSAGAKYSTNQINYSIEQNAYWKTSSFAAIQEIHSIKWNPEVHYHVHKRPTFVSYSGSLQTTPCHPNRIL